MYSSRPSGHLRPWARDLGYTHPDAAKSLNAVVQYMLDMKCPNLHKPRARTVIRSIFSVYLDESGNRLAYAQDNCGTDDIAPPFFLHVTPVDSADLPEHRR